MKLLFNEHLSYKLVHGLSDIFPESKHVKDLQLENEANLKIWEFAKTHNFIIATKDADFIGINGQKGHDESLVNKKDINLIFHLKLNYLFDAILFAQE
ncbi:DUF5615 family PIN-like protein [Candidatus Albibeggiatoa sp. nov. BB20]|uniref:DUF5615 family PIN-like protein n=1 Tax=Candidatus Albibeggiatoa sp. nov. BB20 TaxID=3162723 RepID=UPI0033657674